MNAVARWTEITRHAMQAGYESTMGRAWRYADDFANLVDETAREHGIFNVQTEIWAIVAIAAYRQRYAELGDEEEALPEQCDECESTGQNCLAHGGLERVHKAISGETWAVDVITVDSLEWQCVRTLIPTENEARAWGVANCPNGRWRLTSSMQGPIGYDTKEPARPIVEPWEVGYADSGEWITVQGGFSSKAHACDWARKHPADLPRAWHVVPTNRGK